MSNLQPIHGKHYRELHGKAGWFNSPRVARAFGVNFALEPDGRKQAIKSAIYTATGVDSLAKLPPADFVRLIASKGLVFTLPTSLKAVAGADPHYGALTSKLSKKQAEIREG